MSGGYGYFVANRRAMPNGDVILLVHLDTGREVRVVTFNPFGDPERETAAIAAAVKFLPRPAGPGV